MRASAHAPLDVAGDAIQVGTVTELDPEEQFVVVAPLFFRQFPELDPRKPCAIGSGLCVSCTPAKGVQETRSRAYVETLSNKLVDYADANALFVALAFGGENDRTSHHASGDKYVDLSRDATEFPRDASVVLDLGVSVKP